LSIVKIRFWLPGRFVVCWSWPLSELPALRTSRRADDRLDLPGAAPALLHRSVSAMTSGVVPDLFQNTPAEIIALYAWQDKLVDVSEVVETQREE
jgi:hypothetical protein